MGKLKQDIAIQKDSEVLTKLLDNLKTIDSLETARAVGKDFIDSLRGKEQVQKLYRKLDSCTTVQKVQALCYNTLLSGEGMATARW